MTNRANLSARTEFTHRHIRIPAILLLLGLATGWLGAQPVPLSITPGNETVTVSWAAGLDWVQPQRLTDLGSGAWEDVGGPTSAQTLVQGATGFTGFYRLRLLPPTLTAQPLGRTNAVGGAVTFDVSATGTAPLAYQWHKDGVSLPGRTAARLTLTNLSLTDAGRYGVTVTNRAGRATSGEAVLTVLSPPASPRGIYMGKFGGQADNGGFAALVRPDGRAVAVGYNTPQDEGVFIRAFGVQPDGSFSAPTAQQGRVTGVFTTTGVTGTFVNSDGLPGSFEGSRKADSGIQAGNAGYYAGTYDGLFQGSAFAVLAADGSLFFYTIDDPASPTADGDGGGFASVNAANALSGTTVPNGLTVTGNLNPATAVLSGSYGLGGAAFGTFRLTRTVTP
jgi:hypothetical protein